MILSEDDAKIFAGQFHLQPGYSPLYGPDPFQGVEAQIGDVGVFVQGSFKRLLNATVGVEQPPNLELQIPPFVPLRFNPDTDVENTPVEARVIKPYVPFGGGTLAWTAEGPPEAPTAFTCTKTTDKAVFTLIAPSCVQDTRVKEEKMDEWRRFEEKNVKAWVAYARQRLNNGKINRSDVLLVRGFVKCTKWILAATRAPGTYRLQIEDRGLFSPRLFRDGVMLESKNDIDFGLDFRAAVDPNFTAGTRCLLIYTPPHKESWYKSFKMSAAAEPRDPGKRDGEYGPSAIPVEPSRTIQPDPCLSAIPTRDLTQTECAHAFTPAQLTSTAATSSIYQLQTPPASSSCPYLYSWRTSTPYSEDWFRSACQAVH